MNRADKAVEAHKEGYNCSQAVFSAFSDKTGVDEKTARAIAAAFGGGLGRKGFICGAVTGALMVIGAQIGGDKEKKEENYAKAVRFIDRFTEKHGSIICRKLIECDISKPEGLKKARESGVFEKVCFKLVRNAVELLEEEFV
jgi:C_GCAxxG_C_C family probable redox protein